DVRMGWAVLGDGGDLHPFHAAGGIDLADRHYGRIMQRLLDDREPAGQREEHADLDLARRLHAGLKDPWRGDDRAAREQTIPEKPASVDRHNSAPLVCRRTNPFAP